jgi:S-adenosylmethionine:tRNA ribosyltransferase-isomerase
MDSSVFNYKLPSEAIAQVPSKRRDDSRLLLVKRKTGQISHHSFKHFPDVLPTRCALFRNNATVFKSRIIARRETGGEVECLLLNPSNESQKWWCFLKPGKRLKLGSSFEIPGVFKAFVRDKRLSGECLVEFEIVDDISVLSLSERVGKMPLPPYIHRQHNDGREHIDNKRYQTIYADKRKAVAVAAPTAGLHFSQEILNKLKRRGVVSYDVTLHIGAGTFKPIQSKRIEDHVMHKEFYEISPATCKVLKNSEIHPRIAIGTTSLRVIEDFTLRAQKDFSATTNSETAFSTYTDLFIYPPVKTFATDLLLTNFHLPKSTLMCLVAAFLTPGDTSGIEWLKEIYREAIALNYRFFSYGDAMLIV